MSRFFKAAAKRRPARNGGCIVDQVSERYIEYSRFQGTLPVSVSCTLIAFDRRFVSTCLNIRRDCSAPDSQDRKSDDLERRRVHAVEHQVVGDSRRETFGDA